MRDGVITDGVLSFEIVLADGRLLSTGSAFFRPFGPDLTGLFAADTGALGVKATVTLQLVREGSALGYGSYSLSDREEFFYCDERAARAGLASESFGFDPFLQCQRLKRESVLTDARSLLAVMKQQHSTWNALKEGARLAAAGRSFLDEGSFSLHLVCEGRHESGVTADLAAIRRLIGETGGREVENTIPKLARANPFPPLNSMVGPAGERWVPVHGLLPHGRLIEAWQRIQQLFSPRHADMDQLGVGAGAMFAAVSPSACLIEPVFYRPDELETLHRRTVEPEHLERLTRFAANEESRVLVKELRAGVIRVFRELQATHLQIAIASTDQSIEEVRQRLLES